MIDLVKIVGVEALGEYRLLVRFTTGEVGERDFADLVAEDGQMVEPLRAPAFFARVFVQNGVLAWPNGFDLDAIALYHEMRDARLLRSTAMSAE